ncbi:MAG: matrixin family metalloprotease [Dehalococcoidia bacterium]|nr:matrixin family metalloprotease [Dehalococcoidia bacterium]
MHRLLSAAALLLVALAAMIASDSASTTSRAMAMSAVPPSSTERSAPEQIGYFSDCDGGAANLSGCGPPPARWSGGSVSFCLAPSGRPSGVSDADFRSMVAEAAATWSRQEAAVTVVIGADCPEGQVFGNFRNEIGWSQEINATDANRAAATIGRWRTSVQTGEKTFVEADLAVSVRFAGEIPQQCLRAVILHEMGHSLGLGHSTTPGDLMYASFNPNVLSTCTTTPSAENRQALQSLYGVASTPATPPVANGQRSAVFTSTPPRGASGLLVTPAALSSADLVASLTASGCRAEVVGVLRNGQWLLYIVGAPAQANSAFPANLLASTPFYARCGA